MDIEQRIKVLSRGALGALAAFLAAFLFIQWRIGAQQRDDEQRLTPVREGVAQLDTAVTELLLRQSRLASAETSQQVAQISPREAQLARLEAGLGQLRGVLVEPEDRVALKRVEEDTAQLLALDHEFADAVARHRQNRERLAAAIRGVEGELKQFLEASQGVSGKMRFASGSAMRALRRHLTTQGYDGPGRLAVEAQLDTTSARRRGLVSDVQGLASELNRLAGKVGLVETADQLRSLVANELSPTHEGLSAALDELSHELTADAELSAMVGGLRTSLVPLARKIVDAAEPGSLVSLKAEVQRAAVDVDARQQALGSAGRAVSADVEGLVRRVEQDARAFSASLARVVSIGGWMIALLSLVGAGLSVVGTRQVRRSIAQLRGQNVELTEARVQLSRANATLEEKVAERTRTIRTILDHVRVGFFLCDGAGSIDAGHTRSCGSLLGTDELAGRTLGDVLGLSQRDRADFDAQLSQAFDDILPEELVFAQLPSRFQVGQRTIRLEGSAVRDAAGQVSQVLFSVLDVTALEAARAKDAANQVLLRLLKSKEQFARYLVSAVEQLGVMRDAAHRGDEAVLRRELHTLKGNLGLYGLSHAASIAHAVESNVQIDASDVAAVEASIASFLDENFAVLGLRLGSAVSHDLVVDGATLSRLDRAEREARSPEWLRSEVRAFLRDVACRPARELLGPLEALGPQLAERLGKDVEVFIDGREIRLDPRRALPVLEALPHLVKNAIHHGVESPEDRGEKPSRGRVRVSFTESLDEWQIVVDDDGRGLPLEALRARAVALGLLAQEAPVSEEALIALVFADQLSTADTVTDVSGRGVGMGAVARAVELVGGRLALETRAGHGTRVAVQIPKHVSSTAGAAVV